MVDSLLDGGEGAAIEQVGDMHGVTGTAKRFGELRYSGRQPLGVVEQQNFSHELDPFVW
jgi:hypothetical protein